MKQILSLLSFFILTTSLSAQTAGVGTGGGANAISTGTALKGNTRIVGTVLDSANSNPVEFANIALMEAATNKPVNGAICDDKGKFMITKVAEGTYHLVITFLGYETTTIHNLEVAEKKDEINLGIIKLRMKVEVLKEVVVEGQKSLIEERVDRTVYNAENDLTTKGGDATDVLKRVPLLSVDLDGNVSLRGSSNVMVLINNKPSTIVASSVADALKQIPADQIKTVEVITSPSAKYDAEGTGGIINIITKKNTLQGATLNIDAGVGLRGSNLGLNGNYRTGKMGFSLGGWGRTNYNVNGSFENSQFSDNEGTKTWSVQKADTRNQGLFGNYTLGWDYDINDKNSLAASVRFGARNNNSWQDDLSSVTEQNGEFLNSTLQNVKTVDQSGNVDINLTYTRLFEKPQREFSILTLYSRNNRDNDFERMTTDFENYTGPLNTINKNNSYNEEITVQADYVTPIGSNQIMEFGGKNIMRKVYSDFNYEQDFDGDGIYEVTSGSSAQSNNLNYDQNVTSGYFSYTISTQKGYSFKAGSRYEYTTIDAYTKTESDIRIPSYGILVPSINISKKLKDGKTLKASYNRRIQRPSIQFLNPNIQNSNPINQSKGNPELEPEYTNNFEISYSTFIQGTSLNFSTFWRNTNNSIQSIRTPITTESGQEGIQTSYANIGQEDAYGTSVFANVNVGKLSLNGGTDVYYAVLDNNVPEPEFNASNKGWVASYRLFGSYNLTKGWGFQFFGFYRGRQVQLQGYQTGFGIYSLGLKKDIADKKGSIGFGAENFFTPAFRVRAESASPLYQQKSVNVFHNMSFRLNFSYRIGKMNMDARPKRRRSINNDDLKEGDSGGGGQDSGGGNQGGGQGQQRGGGGFTPQVTPSKTAAAPVALKTDTAALIVAEGTWLYTVESPQGGEGTLIITKDGDKYTGTINNKRFNRDIPLTSVTLTGNELSFSYHVAFGANEMDIQVKAIVTGDNFTGNMMVGQFGTFPITAKKQ